MGFFDKLLNKFGGREATKKSIIKVYKKGFKKGRRSGFNPYKAHMESLSRTLDARSKFSSFNINKAKIITEIYPFLQMSQENAMDVFAEYILYLEGHPEVSVSYLMTNIENALKDVISKKDSLGEEFNEHLSIMREAHSIHVKWVELVGKELSKKIKQL